MAEDIPVLHGGNLAVIEMEIGAADAGESDLDYGIAGVEDLRIRYSIHLNMMLAMPAYSLHRASFRLVLHELSLKCLAAF
jgi:hypothetical protein